MADEIFNIVQACDELKIPQNIYLRIALKAVVQTQQDLELLRQANQSSNVGEVMAIAHRFKGDFANLRINCLSEIAAQLDTLAKENYEAEKAKQLTEQFTLTFGQVKEFLQAQE